MRNYFSRFALTFIFVAIAATVVGNSTKTDASPAPTIRTSQAQTTKSSGGKFSQVELSSLASYTYGNGLFTMNVPKHWTVRDRTDASRVFVQWLDSTRNGAIFVRMTKGQSNPTLEQLGEELRSFLNSAYQSEPDFQMSLPVEQPDKTSKIEWSFTAKGDNGAKGTLQGDSYILQVADKVAIVTFIAPQEQFNDLEPAFNQIFSSYKIYRQVDLPQQPLP